MRRSIVTSMGSRRITAEEENGRITGLFLENSEEQALVGRIFAGRVSRIQKNIRAAFVDGGGFLCYYPLEEWERHPTPGMEGRPLREGDTLLLQIEKEALKTKAPVASSRLTLTGEYLVLMTGKAGLHFSSRITDPERKEALRALLSSAVPERSCEDAAVPTETEFEMIVRTNGQNAPDEAILAEKDRLEKKMKEILTLWPSRTAGSVLYEPEPAFLGEIFNHRISSLEEIVTDDRAAFRLLTEKKNLMLSENPECRLPQIRYYEDSYPLVKLYGLESVLKKAAQEKVWLKSGGYLVIQPTEALVSIDVNTGKYCGKKQLEETFFRTNLEAAEEIAVQLKLRNLSGIIIVDFIDMADPQHKEQLLEAFRRALEKDPVKTVILGYTRLNLVELTRKKVRRPLHEILK